MKNASLKRSIRAAEKAVRAATDKMSAMNAEVATQWKREAAPEAWWLSSDALKTAHALSGQMKTLAMLAEAEL